MKRNFPARFEDYSSVMGSTKQRRVRREKESRQVSKRDNHVKTIVIESNPEFIAERATDIDAETRIETMRYSLKQDDGVLPRELTVKIQGKLKHFQQLEDKLMRLEEQVLEKARQEHTTCKNYYSLLTEAIASAQAQTLSYLDQVYNQTHQTIFAKVEELETHRNHFQTLVENIYSSISSSQISTPHKYLSSFINQLEQSNNISSSFQLEIAEIYIDQEFLDESLRDIKKLNLLHLERELEKNEEESKEEKIKQIKLKNEGIKELMCEEICELSGNKQKETLPNKSKWKYQDSCLNESNDTILELDEESLSSSAASLITSKR